MEQVGKQVEQALQKHYSSSGSAVSGHVQFHWRAERWLLQVMGDKAGHGDIWFWQMSDDKQTVYNPDFTFANLKTPTEGYRHPTSWILPTKRMQWNGLAIPIAHDVDRVLQNQFGPNFRVPYKSRLQCVENLYTKVYPEFSFYCYVFCFPAVGALLTVLYFIRSFRRKLAKIWCLGSVVQRIHLFGFSLLLVIAPTLIILSRPGPHLQSLELKAHHLLSESHPSSGVAAVHSSVFAFGLCCIRLCCCFSCISSIVFYMILQSLYTV